MKTLQTPDSLNSHCLAHLWHGTHALLFQKIVFEQHLQHDFEASTASVCADLDECDFVWFATTRCDIVCNEIRNIVAVCDLVTTLFAWFGIGWVFEMRREIRGALLALHVVEIQL